MSKKYIWPDVNKTGLKRFTQDNSISTSQFSLEISIPLRLSCPPQFSSNHDGHFSVCIECDDEYFKLQYFSSEGNLFFHDSYYHSSFQEKNQYALILEIAKSCKYLEN